MVEEMSQVGRQRTVLEANFAALWDKIRAEERAKTLAGVVARERNLLRRQTERKFGTEAGKHVARILARIDDQDRLDEAGEWIIVCDDAGDLIAELEAIPS